MAESKKKFFKYSETQLKQAVNDITNNVCTIRQAERMYGVPHSTLINKLKGRSSLTRQMGPSTILTKDEEDILVRWLLASAKKGFPLNKVSLCETVRDIIKTDDRLHKFRDGLPGKKWLSSFLRRHPEISQRHAEAINGARAVVTERSIREWHDSIRSYLIEENAEDILTDPSRILNSDESGFATNPKTGLVLGPRGMRNFYEVKSGSEKECITALFTISADGEIYPPMIVYPYERIPAEIVRNTNPDWAIGRSKKGWMTSETFFSYVCNSLLPYLKKKGVKLPILYILDGHKSHLTFNLSKFCSQNGIFLYALLPNATHILQPADVSLFAPLKSKWKKVVSDWKRSNNNKIVNKATFPFLLENSVQQIEADTVKNGFRKCGLYPFNVEAIDFTKSMHDASRILDQGETEKIKPTNFDIPHFLYFESLIPTKRREEFKKTEMGEWVGDESAKELYHIWRKLKKRCQNKEKYDKIEVANDSETAKDETKNDLKIEENNSDTKKAKLVEVESEVETELEVQRNLAEMEGTETNKIPILIEEDFVKKEATQNEDRVIILSDVIIRKPAVSVPPLQPKKRNISAAFLDHIFWPEESPEKKDFTRKEKLPYATTSLKWLQYHEEKEKKKNKKEKEKQEKALLRKQKKEQKLKETEKKKLDTKRTTKILKKKTKENYSNSSESECEEWQESGSSLDDISDEDFSCISKDDLLLNVAKYSSSDSEDLPLINISKKLKKDISVGDFYVVAFPGKKMYHNYVCSVQNIYDTGEIEVQAFASIEGSKSQFKIIENDISVINSEQLVRKLQNPSKIITGNRVKYRFCNDVI